MLQVQLLRSPADKRRLLSKSLAPVMAHFDPDMLAHRSYLAALDPQGQVLGLVCFVESSARTPGALGIAFVSTHVQHRRQGVARALVEALFELASTESKPVAMTPYEDDGEKYLKPLVAHFAAQFPSVTVYER